MLLLMRHYEKIEDYVECHLIKKAIENKNKRLNFNLPTNPHIDIREYLLDGEYTDEKERLALQIVIDAKNYSDLIISGQI